jgi:site-specific DNA-cytosine methylase
MAGRDFSNELFPTSAPSSGRDFSAELFAEENRKRKQLRQSDPILSPEDAVMSSVGAPSTELPLPRKNVAPVDTSQPMTAEQYKAAVDKRDRETPTRSIGDAALDTGISLLKGVIGLPEAFVGLADIPTKGKIGKLLEDYGYKPNESKKILDAYLSEGQQIANRKLRETKGFFPTIQTALENPSTIATSVVESAPQMLGGAGIARGLLKAAPSVAPFVAGALGEGTLAAGSAAEQIRGRTKDKLLTTKQAISAAASGAGTSLFGAVGGLLAKKLGFADIDTLLASGATTGTTKSLTDFIKKASASGVSEGLFEEMPQSAQEQVWMNYATDKPLMEGVAEAAGMGAVTGFAMGVGGAGGNALLQRRPTQAAPPQEPAGGGPAPTPPPGKMPPEGGGRVEPSFDGGPSFTPPSMPSGPGARIEPSFDNAPPVNVPPPIVEAVPGMMTDEDIAQPENLTVTPVTLTEPEVTPVTPIQPTLAAALLPETPTVPPAQTPKLFEPSIGEHQAQDMTVVAVPVKELTLSKDVPQFKAGASSKGVVEPLSGKFTQEGVAPIAVWRRLDGAMEVISGRHRLDLAKRSNTDLINAQVYDEAKGFNQSMAATLDAELNIRDEQGKVKDYVNYFKESGTDRETADAKGFLARTKGKRGFTIANQGSDALIAAINSDQIGDEAAYYVAINAPNDERLQSVGLKALMDGKSMNTATNTMQAVKAMAGEQDTTTDMFGFDDSLIKEAQEMAKIAAQMQQAIKNRLSAITGAAKNPAMAKAEGIDVRDPAAIQQRIEELKQRKTALENWSTSPELVAEIRAARGVAPPVLPIFEQPVAPVEPQDDFLSMQTPEELRKRAEAQAEAARQQAIAGQEAQRRTQADSEVGDFVLTGSDRDADEAAARGQEDLFGAAPPTTTESETSAEYDAAMEKSNVAIRKFRNIQEAYRNQTIGDEEFLAGRRDYDAAMADYDNAVRKEQGMVEESGVRGASDEEVADVSEAFDNAKQSQESEGITRVFDAPAKSEIVRMENKTKDDGFLTIKQAKARIAEWKKNAEQQGETRENSDKIVLSLFDMTGQWSAPWEEAGYQVYRFDIQTDPEMGDVTKFSAEFFNDLYGAFEGQDVYAILAACPCTDFASSGARHFAAKDADGRTVESVELVQQTLRTVEYFKPSIWAIENPVGRIEKLTGLPPWRLSFNPNHFGDPYTKKTLLWGRFNADLPTAPVEPVEGSKMHRMYGGKSQATKNARSVTPEGFAYAFFTSNNAIDNPVVAVANKYDMMDPAVIRKAVNAGMTGEQIANIVDDPYYFDLDYKAANDALSNAVTPAKGAVTDSQERIIGMTKKEYRNDEATLGRSTHPSLSIDFDGQDPKSLINQYGEKNVRFLGRLFGITVKDIKSVAKKLLDINDNVNTIAGRTADDFKGMTKAELEPLRKQLGFSTYLSKEQLIGKIVDYQPELTDKVNTRLQDAKHQAAVTNALRQGVDVKDEVIKDYPDLTAYTRERGSEIYNQAIQKLALKETSNLTGTMYKSRAEGLRELVKKEEDPQSKQVWGDVADKIDQLHGQLFGKKQTEEAPAILEEDLPEAIAEEKEFIEEDTKDKLEAIAQDFMVGDMVRFGSIPGTVVGVEGDYVRMRPDDSKSAKAYQRVPKSSLTFVGRPDTTTMVSYSKEQDNKFGEEAGQLNANMGNLIQLLGANMYSSSLAEVTVKELLQNAFDAVKGAVADTNSKGESIKPLYKTGKIQIAINSNDRTISITDNARGMTPQIVRDAFFTVAGSDKSDLPPGQRSGGLGLAKMGFMLGAENLKLDTVRDGVRVTVDTSSTDIANNNFTIQKSPAPKGEHGTTVTVKIPQYYIDPKNGDEKPIYFPYSLRSIGALNKPLIGPVEVSFKRDTDESAILPIGVNFEKKNYTQFKANFDWGSADIFFGIERKPEQYSINHQVLSAGVYQFSPSFKLDNELIPYDIIVNIAPNVDARHPDYPFVNSRESFKDRIKQDVEALQQYLGQISRGLEAKDLQESFKGVVSMPRMEAGQDIADIADKLKKTFGEKKQEKPTAAKALPKEVTVTADAVTDTQTQQILVDVKAKQAEKQKDASFKGSEAPKATDFMLDLKQDPKLPAYHNNTNVDYLAIGRPYGEPEQFFAELGTLVVEMKEELAKSGFYGYEKLSPESLFFAGVSIDKKYGGVHIRVPYKAIFVNPFYSFGGRTIFGIRQQLLNTMMHEIAHTGSMDHGVAHNTQMIKVEQYLADEGLLDYYRDAILDVLRRHESTFTAMKEAYDKSSTQNTSKSLEDYAQDSSAASARGDEGGARNAPSAIPSRERQGRGEGVSRAQADDEKRQDRKGAREDGKDGKPSDFLMNVEKPNKRQINTPEFKRWFGRSKVVNEDGSPKVMYHGTNKDFNEFVIAEKANRTGMPDGFYFTSDADDASRYAEGEGANVLPVYLSIKNPYNLGGKNKISNEMVMQFRDELRKDNPNLPFSWIQEKVDIFKEKTAAGRFPFPNISFPTAAMQRVFKAGGYDGLIDGDNVFVAFNKNQVKSATGNRGTFDESANILQNVTEEPSLAEQEGDLIFGSKAIREAQIAEYARLRSQLARVPKQVAEGKVDLRMQAAVTRLMQQARDLNSEIKSTKPRRDSAEQFLAKAALEFDKGNISEDVFNVIKMAYDKMPDVLEGLLFSVKSPGKNIDSPVAGQFLVFERIVRLYKGTSGIDDPVTIRHELTHSLEQMMNPEQRLAVAQAWVKGLLAAIKRNPDETHQKYFNAVMDFMDNPSETNFRKAVKLLPNYEMYQFINPSEFWAVNAEKLMAAELGTAWEKFKRAIARLWEGIKNVVGFDNRYVVQKMFKDIMNGSRNRITTDMLVDLVGDVGVKFNVLENIEDDKKLLEKYSRPNTPQLDSSPLKTQIINSSKLGKEFIKLAVSDPLGALGTAANSVDRAVLYARNKNVWFGSGLNAADFSKYNGELLNSQGLATASVALDNAIRGGQIATEVIFQGGIKFDPKSRNFVAVQRDKGMRGVYEAEAALKKRLGNQLGTDIIQGYLEAKRSRSIQSEYFQREAEYEYLQNDYEELRTAGASEEDVMAARDAMADAKNDLKAIEVAYKKISMSEEEIDEFIARDKVHPELRKIMQNWSAINQNMLSFWRQVGLLSESRYENLSNIQDYVPWQRIMNDETDIHSPVQTTNRKMTNIGLEKLFKKGKPTVITDVVAKEGQQDFKIQPATEVDVEINGNPVDPDKVTMTADGKVKLDVPVEAGDLVVFKASREIENIIDNMTRNVMRMTMNGLRQAAAQRIVMEYATRDKNKKVMVFPKADKERGRFDFIVNGQRIVVEIQDPLIAESIFGMESLNLAMLKPLAAIANFTRRTITLSGAFQIKQVFKDAPTAALVTGVKHPLLLIGGVYKGFVTSLTNTDPTIKILKAAGIGGFASPSRTPEAEIKRRLGIMNRNVFDFMIKGLDHIGDASDMAQRVAVYKRVLAETGDETQALYQAANVINFLHHGSGQVSQMVVKTVPFAGAYANSMDVLIQALAGGGLKGRSRSSALARLAMTGTLLTGITLLYCMLVGDDDEYNQMDDQTKMRNFMIPGTKIILPMNTSAAYFYKAVPEMIYNKIMKEGTKDAVDERRLRTALKEAAMDMLLGPTPVPSGIKPFIEIGLNKDFFTGRPVVPESLAKLDAAERYMTDTSEAGKFLSSLTGTKEKRILDPIEADHIIKGLFGTAGAMAQWFSNSIAVSTGERVAMTEKQTPLTGAFLRADVGRRNEDLFYDFKSLVDNKYGTYSKMLEREDYDKADDYEKKYSDILIFYKDVNKIDTDLKEINALVRYYGESKDTGLTPDKRRQAIKELQIDKQNILEDTIEMRKEAGL